MLIQQLTSSHQVSADRFYRTLYESLLDPRVATTSKQVLYLNLLYKALKNDLNVRRVKAFIKRIVQVLGLHQPSFICGIFYLIRELEKTFTGVQSLFDQPEENEDDEEEIFRDVPDEDEKQDEPAPQSKPQNPTNGYDSRKRDPEHSNADKSCLWELVSALFRLGCIVTNELRSSLTCPIIILPSRSTLPTSWSISPCPASRT